MSQVQQNQDESGSSGTPSQTRQSQSRQSQQHQSQNHTSQPKPPSTSRPATSQASTASNPQSASQNIRIPSQDDSHNQLHGSDRRQIKNRFGWVRRLMQGQTRESGSLAPRSARHESHSSRVDTGYPIRTKHDRHPTSSSAEVHPSQTPHSTHSSQFRNSRDPTREKHSYSSTQYSFDSDQGDGEGEGGPTSDSDQMTTNSDNISTTPLKSIISVQSTKSPSILSDNNLDQNSLNASTAETSIAPSTYTTNYVTSAQPPLLHAFPDRDSESIVTLASSSRRRRRRSIDTNSSTAGIPPASIMERLSVQPTAANSTYAASVRTSQIDPSQSSMYDSTDQTSSVRSEGIEA